MRKVLAGLALALATLVVSGVLAGAVGRKAPGLAGMSAKLAAHCFAIADRRALSSVRQIVGENLCGALDSASELATGQLTVPSPVFAAAAGPAYPLRISSSGRYLVDQNNTPFMVVGDSPQAMIGALSKEDAEKFLADRHARGFNAVWVNLLCNDYTGCEPDGSTIEGLAPFTTPGDLATPNQVYFARAEDIVDLAAKYGISVFLDPIETGGWLSVLRRNGVNKAYAYGVYLGTRYRNVANIVWMSGNDFQSWRDAEDDALVLAVARGIRAADPNHLQTVELDYYASSSFDDSNWLGLAQLDAAYTYKPTYAEVLKD